MSAAVATCDFDCPTCAELRLAATGAAQAREGRPAGPGNAVSLADPSGWPEPDTDPRTLTSADELEELMAAQPTARELLPDPGETARTLVQAVLEVLCGDRPARQLCGTTADLLLRNIEARIGRHGARPWAASVRSVHVCEPAPGVAEVSAVVVGLAAPTLGRGHRQTAAPSVKRCRAIALRLEGLDGRWVMTALTIG